jgi:ribosomal protein S4E
MANQLKVTRATGALEAAQQQRCDDATSKASTERLILAFRLLTRDMLGEIEELREGIKILEEKLVALNGRQKSLFGEDF